ncbi:MAG: hydroxyquinol 1,2-dioxygenase [Scytonema sp. RU_4_4]|nr:hydroxyquinol 1,2-dioxygenase [Scytonema sp. RU_4_4]
MKKTTLDNITQAVINSGDGGKTHPRLYQIYTSLVRYLHEFVQEVNLTNQELQVGLNFLTRLGRPYLDMPKGEFYMLPDLIGLSELVTLLHDTNHEIATESNLEGPMYRPNAQERQMGDSLGVDEDGETLLLSGRISDLNGKPIANAIIDVWQPNSKGFYDLQDSNQSSDNFRGRFKTGSNGRYTFKTVIPGSYQVPDNGPSGELLRLLGRHPWRAAHIHIKLDAPTYTPLTTQIYIGGTPYLDSDVTFSVRSAVIYPQKHESAIDKAHNQDKPFYTANFDFVLKSAVEQAKVA